MNTDVMFSKATDLWETPDELFEQFHRTQKFTLDAAADESNHKLDRWFGPGGIAEDALSVDWTGERVWLNPPYSQAKEFLAKAVHEQIMNGVPSCVLVPSRTDTKWFHEYVWSAPYCVVHPWVRKLHFLKGRVKFIQQADSELHFNIQNKPNSAPFPSLVIEIAGY